ncbi:MAG: metallophosphoesterase [Tannerellaceae bacterium]|jgi:predicted MPP superfamily phosphohydrolase|nr:metallophosphoesterase [Tannerellaceae bacterium]
MHGLHTNIRIYALWLLVAALMVCCRKNDDVDDNMLRGDNKFYYTVNNIEAMERVSLIMYNGENPSEREERFKLIHISDPHLSGWSTGNHASHPNNLIESVVFANQRELRIDAMVETGDHISNAPAKIARENMESFFHHLYAENYIPTFSCYGNHDANMDNRKDAYITSGELAEAINRHTNYPQGKILPGKSYYYADVPNPQGGMIRIIALYMLDQPGSEYDALHYTIYSQEQINWLGNVALKEGMSDRHSVIVLAHFPFQESAWKGKATLQESYLRDADFVHTWKLVPEIIEAFRTRSIIDKTYPNILFPQRVGINAGFDFSDATGEFVCYLGGHAHCFALFDVRNTGAILPPQKMILCSNQSPSESNSVYNRVHRIPSSLISNSFNIYAVDTKEKKVYITFFGAYIPFNEPNFPSVMEFSYL